MTGGKDLITAQALAQALDLSIETVWRYTREKKIPFIELGNRQYRYNYFDVVSALSNSVVREKDKDNYGSESTNKYTYQDYLDLPEEPGYSFEILEGELIKEPSPSVPHQRVSRRLQRMLEDYFWSVDSEGEIFDAPLDVTFGNFTVVQPDLFYIAGKQKDIVKETRIDGAPTLVVEILSPSTSRKDRLRKLKIYQRGGVLHYWLVNPDEKSLECFALLTDMYTLITSGMDDDILEHPDFQGLSIDLATLWK